MQMIFNLPALQLSSVFCNSMLSKAFNMSIESKRRQQKIKTTAHSALRPILQCTHLNVFLVCQEKANFFMGIAMHIKKTFVHITIMGCLVIVLTFEIS